MQELYKLIEEKIKNAAEIAAVSESMEKFIFTVFYIFFYRLLVVFVQTPATCNIVMENV